MKRWIEFETVEGNMIDIDKRMIVALAFNPDEAHVRIEYGLGFVADVKGTIAEIRADIDSGPIPA